MFHTPWLEVPFWVLLGLLALLAVVQLIEDVRAGRLRRKLENELARFGESKTTAEADH